MKHKKYLRYIFSLAGVFMIAALIFLLRAYHSRFFKETTTGLQYQVVSHGKGPSPQKGDILLINAYCKTEKGDVLFNTANQELPMVLTYLEEFAQKKGGFEEAVGMLQKGVSLIFKMSAEKLFGQNPEYTTPQDGLKKDKKIFLHLQL